ncbi:NAD(P)-binding domain-containing protein [Pseudoflavitalea sp. G-6-1-2]|uniref:NADPH-dependent F420 reductase n=1 Tax=Pseudoflavitalea sp. G-6-1-2 TaxID=2728841 RepID=UPI00146BD253|nr:NAD(P)-binding domain-containing protein [Pseudoflavitalea sp. G-6-1-2]NML19453.1 NAD(P)-binding domain-containing protein [Pseudoflavitalea sp. G-6-1-2]
MKIGIIGAGSVGKVLAKGWIDVGHSVKISSRDPHSESLFVWKEQMGSECHTGSFEEAAAFGDVIILAVNWSGIEAVLQKIGQTALHNKVVIDLSNAVEFSETPQLALKGISAGELIQQWLPESRVVKTLNMVGSSSMVHPHYDEGIPAMFLCGNDEEAKQIVEGLLQQIGWKTILDIGDITRSGLLESLMLTCLISEIKQQCFGAAFALLRK